MQEETSKIWRVALYARVSTDEQREGQTIDSQIAELDRFAREKGWQITGVYKDDGWSGTILDRPELDRLRDDGSKGLFDIALINDVDRLARDVSHLGIVKRDLQRHGVQLVFRKLPAEQSPTHNLMVNILGSFAEFERELILDRTRRGRRHKVEVRKQFLGGLAPYGFRYVAKDKAAAKEGYLEIAPEEATIVRQMFEWVDKEGLSASKVAARLGAMNVAPRKNGKRWGKSSILRVLRSETYAGVWHYNKHEGCEPLHPPRVSRYRKSLKSSVRLRPRSEWLPVVLPEKLRLIDRDRWQRVQEQLTRNITFSPRNSRHQYLLKGLVTCGGCSARYVGDPNHSKYYYRCHARCKKLPTIKEKELDRTVWGAIEEAVLNPELIADQLEQSKVRRAAMGDGSKTEEYEIDGARSQVRTEEARILEAYRKSIITPEQLGVQLEQINARKKVLEARAAQVSSKIGADPMPISKRSVSDWCQQFAEGLKRFTDQDKQKFLRLIVNEIVFEGERIRIRGVIPVTTATDDYHSVRATVPPQSSDLQSRTASTAAHQRDRSPAVSDDRVAATAVHQRGRSPSVSNDRTATTTVYQRGRNPVVSNDRVAGTAVYNQVPNRVCDITFELIKLVPKKPLPLREQLDDFFIRTMVKQNPGATLEELCELVQEERGVSMHKTSMDRLLLRLRLTHRVRKQLAAGEQRVNLAA